MHTGIAHKGTWKRIITLEVVHFRLCDCLNKLLLDSHSGETSLQALHCVSCKELVPLMSSVTVRLPIKQHQHICPVTGCDAKTLTGGGCPEVRPPSGLGKLPVIAGAAAELDGLLRVTQHTQVSSAGIMVVLAHPAPVLNCVL